MDERKLDALVQRVDHLVDLMESPEHLSIVAEQRAERIVHDNTALQLSNVTEPDFNDLLNKLRSERSWSPRFSERTIKSEVLSAIVARINGADSKSYIRSAVDRFEAWHPRHRVLVPLSGVTLDRGVSFDFGRVTLVQMNEALFAKEIADRLPQSITIYSPDRPIAFAVDVQSDLEKTSLYASYTVDVDVHRAAELADKYVSPIADYLQFCVAIMAGGSVCMVEHKARHLRKNVSPVVLIDETSGSGSLQSINDEHYVRFIMSQASFDHLKFLGITDLAALFGVPDINIEEEYARLIYRAIRVFAEGERSTSPRQKILSYVTACELFLSQKTETTKAVTEGVAFILGSDYDARRTIREAMVRMYDARSSATHDGLEPADVALYRRQILEVLYHMISMRKLEPQKFKKKADLTAWIDRQRLSGMPVA